eukprot:2406047-Pleurochrysis_carterae.AAC.3
MQVKTEEALHLTLLSQVLHPLETVLQQTHAIATHTKERAGLMMRVVLRDQHARKIVVRWDEPVAARASESELKGREQHADDAFLLLHKTDIVRRSRKYQRGASVSALARQDIQTLSCLSKAERRTAQARAQLPSVAPSGWFGIWRISQDESDQRELSQQLERLQHRQPHCSSELHSCSCLTAIPME